jgi:hypothetical protein
MSDLAQIRKIVATSNTLSQWHAIVVPTLNDALLLSIGFEIPRAISVVMECVNEPVERRLKDGSAVQRAVVKEAYLSARRLIEICTSGTDTGHQIFWQTQR